MPWDAVDAWLEEGRPLVHYPPNPYHRVDCQPTGRRLRVTVAGTLLVDTAETVIVFETSLAPRLYVDPAVVRTELLRRSDTSSYCNYKGYATYWSMVVGDTAHDSRVELRGHPPRDAAHPRLPQFRRDEGRRHRRAATSLDGRLRLRRLIVARRPYSRAGVSGMGVAPR